MVGGLGLELFFCVGFFLVFFAEMKFRHYSGPLANAIWDLDPLVNAIWGPAPLGNVIWDPTLLEDAIWDPATPLGNGI